MPEKTRDINCYQCGAVLAVEHTDERGASWVEVGGVRTDCVRGTCARCGHPIRWQNRTAHKRRNEEKSSNR